MADLAATHRHLLSQVDRLLAIAEDPGAFSDARTDVSRWSPLDHAEHMARADTGSLDQLDKALERSGGPSMAWIGRLVLAVGWIPRGRGAAPESSVPRSAERAQVAADLRAVRARIEALGPRLGQIASVRGRAAHPIFGGLTPARWLRFLEIHHHHHLKIVEDIRRVWRT
jgi:DinB superfamily